MPGRRAPRRGRTLGRSGRSVQTAAAALAVLAAVILVGSTGWNVPFSAVGARLGAADDVAASLLAPAGGATLTLVPAPASLAISASPGDPEPAPFAAGPAFVYPDLYNLADTGAGTVTQSAAAGGALRTTVALSGASGRSSGALGYPEVQFGPKPWCAQASCPEPAVAPALPLPTRLASLPSVAALTQYTLSVPAAGAADVAFDLWLTRTPDPSAASAGDLEVMLWLGHAGPGILPGSPVGTVSIPSYQDGAWTPSTWQLYVQHAVPGDAGGHWTVVYLVLQTPVLDGRVGIGLTEALATAARQLELRYPAGWGPGAEDPLGLYLDDIELGSEFRATAPAGSIGYSWTLAEYQLLVGPGGSA